MTKLTFLLSLHAALSHLPQDEVEARLHFYSEMIEDHMEEGLTEEAAVAAVGTIEEVAAQIAAEIPAPPTAPDTPQPKQQRKIWQIVLLILGASLWLPLLIAALAVALSLYASLWAVIVSLWAAFGAVAGSILGGAAAGVGFLSGGHAPTGVALLGAVCVCTGLAVFLFFGCRAATKGTLLLTAKAGQSVRRLFGKKEDT